MRDLSQFIQETEAEEVGGEFNWAIYVSGDSPEINGRFDVQANSEYEAKETCYLHIKNTKGELREWKL